MLDAAPRLGRGGPANIPAHLVSPVNRLVHYSGRPVSARFQSIYEVVRLIPEGQVATYGDVAALAGRPGASRWAGQALARLDEVDVPWHRVINARGRISLDGKRGREQRRRLMAEGVVFSTGGRVDLDQYRWRPRVSVRPRRGRT